MLRTFRAIDFQSVFKTALYDLMTEGNIEFPRDMETREFVPAVFQIDNPLSRMLSLKTRKANPFYGMIETLWYMNGDDSVAPLAHYNKAMLSFTDDGTTLQGAYGARLIKQRNELDKSQFGLVYDKLKADPSSRQAVMVIWDPWRDHKFTKDVPCTVNFMFTIRQNKLNMTTIMRSNDIIWGATYDVFSFTMFQEFLARKLGVGVGTYTHLANSFHVYKRHYDMAWDMIKDNTPAVLMPEMPETSWSMFNDLYAFEHKVRLGESVNSDLLNEALAFGEYWDQWALMILIHKAIKLGDEKHYEEYMSRLGEPYNTLVRDWRAK